MARPASTLARSPSYARVQKRQTPLWPRAVAGGDDAEGDERRAGMSATARPVPFARMVTTRLLVNGRAMSVTHEARVSLLDLLRERLRLTGTKKGCNEGACGVCTVLVDGRRVNGCMTLAASCDGREVTTVEGLARPDGSLHAVQQALIDHDACPCGYGTPRHLPSAVACLSDGRPGAAAANAECVCC